MAVNTRYEIKLVTSEINLPEVRTWLRLHSTGFYEVYAPRQINNVYFDTPDFDSYNENLAGISSRKKLRLRWYDNQLQKVEGTLELKCKRNLQGWKITQKLEKILDFTQNSWAEIRQEIRPQLKPELFDYFDRFYNPVLINRYQREYYLSFDRKVRITLDFAQDAYDQRLSKYPNLARSILSAEQMVVEVKADRQYASFLSEAIASLPLRVGKHSKYALAMEAIFN